MANQPYEDLYDAVNAMMVDVNTLSVAEGLMTVTQAIVNYGTDFRIASHYCKYQIQVEAEIPHRHSNATYPRATVTVPIHFAVLRPYAGYAYEKRVFAILYFIADTFLDRTNWQSESGIYDLDWDEAPPEMSEGTREGNILTFTLTATVIMDPV